MLFELDYYRRVLHFVNTQKQWPGQRKMLFRLYVLVPLGWLFHAFFYWLDYLFFPALWRVQVRAPVFVVGHARSGTTLMHRLLAADEERFSYFLYWETFFPSLTLKKLLRGIGVLDRIFLGSRLYQRLKQWDEKTFGRWRHIHEQGLWISEEDQFVMKAAFVTQQWALDTPTMHINDIFHLDAMPAQRRRRWMRHYKGCVKRQLLLNGGTRTHLSKNPVMSGWVQSIIDTFPDARFVIMLRDPLQCIPSTLKLVEMTWQAKRWTRENYAQSLQSLTDISFDCFRHPRQVLRANPATAAIAIDYRDLTRAPAATIEQVYSALQIPICDQYRAHLQAREQAEKSHSSHFEYKLEDYALPPTRIASELADFYADYHWPLLETATAKTDEPSIARPSS